MEFDFAPFSTHSNFVGKYSHPNAVSKTPPVAKQLALPYPLQEEPLIPSLSYEAQPAPNSNSNTADGGNLAPPVCPSHQELQHRTVLGFLRMLVNV